MPRLLLVYGTTEGQTGKIAQRIAEVARTQGYETDLREGKQVPADVAFDGYAGVLVGAAVHGASFAPYMEELVRRHRSELERVPAALFYVSLTQAFPAPEQRAKLDAYLARFYEQTGWHPEMVASFAGALAYRRYGFVMRQVMRSIARKGGMPTDTSRDYEFTDWQKVTQFAGEFLALVEEHSIRTATG
jgi:menaquinone-dependent protoporphyrinogen oxidase